jgi:post-segregation antitoxin (ccd killing protein)
MRVIMYISDRLGHEAKETARDEGLSLSALTAKALESLSQRKAEERKWLWPS